MIAVVLGASTGVGAAVAKRLADEGYRVIGFHRGRHPEEAATLTELCGKSIQLIEVDVGRTPGAVIDGIQRLPADIKINVLVHALTGAAMGSVLPRPVHLVPPGSCNITPNKVDTTFNCLAHSFLWWVQELYVREMLNYSAHLVALSNPCPDFYLRNGGVIGPAKAALEAYVRLLAAEFGPQGYFVNAIRFSTVVTPALQKVLQPDAIARLSRLHDSIVPRGRIMIPEDVADIVALHIRDVWTNGAILDATGGAPMMLMDHAFNGKR